MGVVDKPTIASKIFLCKKRIFGIQICDFASRRSTDYGFEKKFLCKIGISVAKYAICRKSEKSDRCSQRNPTAADRPTDNTQSGLSWEPLLLPIVVGAWSNLKLGLVQIDIWARQTDR